MPPRPRSPPGRATSLCGHERPRRRNAGSCTAGAPRRRPTRLRHALLLAACGLLGLHGCVRPEEAPREAAAPDEPPREYGVPDTGDLGFTIHASLGAIAYWQLEPEQREAWARLWAKLVEEGDVPAQEYSEAGPDGQAVGLNLFLRSAMDGYCVAYAHRVAGRLENSRCAEFLRATSGSS